MASTGRGQKAAFLRDLFRGNPEVSYEEANRAWKASGNEEDFSRNTFYSAKTAFRKEARGGNAAGARRPKGRPRKAARPGRATESPSAPQSDQDVPAGRRSNHEAARTGDRDRVLDEVEAGIDDLIFRLKMAGGAPEVEAKLREVRRSLHPDVR